MSRIAVMGGAQAAKTLLQIQVASLKAKGKEITKEDEDKMLNDITARYEKQMQPQYAAARLWIDEIINPLETRKIISMTIEAADHAPISKPFNPGVIQT
jgi:acetyl-CoA carboxylase carboxyltransferase component